MQKDSGVDFIEWCLGTTAGYAAIGSKHHRTGIWNEAILPYPSRLDAISDHIKSTGRASNMYFCPTILRGTRRNKDNIIISTVIWAELDECSPDKLLIPPTVVIETSPHRYQAYWRLHDPEPALDVEDINARIARYHAEDGCDQSGWNLAKHLRIPGTNNYKYQSMYSHSIIVTIIEQNFDRKYDLEDFDVYPGANNRIKKPMPILDGSRTARDILYHPHLQTRLHASAYDLFEETPSAESWSESLWKLELMLVGAGLSDEEVFIVVKESACNKYERDNRPDSHLWADVCRARSRKDNQTLTPNATNNGIGSDIVYVSKKPILSDDEHALVAQRRTFIEEYVDWAIKVTDAPREYHEAGAFTILSGILSGVVKIPTSAGTLRTNLWFMLLGETTISRKTTCQKMAISLLEEVDKDAILATDGSVEGVLSALETRRNRASIYHKDEFAGLLEAMVKRDYLAGSMEHFCQLYDSQHLRRLLKSGNVDIRDPVFIIFGGGIREKIYWNLSSMHIESGFIPRFIFVSPEVDLTDLRAAGPASQESLDSREALLDRLVGIQSHYNPQIDDVGDGSIIFNGASRSWNAKLSEDSWILYNKIEHTMHSMAFESDVRDMMLPMMDRLAKSGLKMAALIAAAERMSDEVVIHPIDILHAFHYIENYVGYSIEIISNADKTASEKLYERMAGYVEEHPGVNRSTLMRRYKLNSKQADGIFATLVDRGMVNSSKQANGVIFYPSDWTTVISTNGHKSERQEEEVDFSESQE